MHEIDTSLDPTVTGIQANAVVTASITDSNVTTDKIADANVTAAKLSATLKTGFIPLDLTTARIISSNAIQATTEGGVPDSNTAPALARQNGATDKILSLSWAAASVVEIQFANIAYPPDLDDASNVEIHLLAKMAGATDTPTLAIGYFEGIGDTNAGGNTAAITGTTLTEYSVAITAANIGTHPNMAAITITPAAHGTDALFVYAAWVEYTRA